MLFRFIIAKYLQLGTSVPQLCWLSSLYSERVQLCVCFFFSAVTTTAGQTMQCVHRHLCFIPLTWNTHLWMIFLEKVLTKKKGKKKYFFPPIICFYYYFLLLHSNLCCHMNIHSLDYQGTMRPGTDRAATSFSL